jgi:hypothetical protein
MVKGYYEISSVEEATGIRKPLFSRANQLMVSWGWIAAQAIGLGNPAYKVAGGYLEFQNVADTGNTVPVPNFLPTDGLSYFNNLPAGNDYLRLPLATTPTISIAPGYNSSFISGFSGNQVTFTLQSGGTVGVNGLPFNYQSLSTIFGITLVAMPVANSPSQDVILSRGYFLPSDQQLKAYGYQTAVSWAITFE